MHLGLAVHGTPFSMGLHADSGRPPIRPLQLMDQALALGLRGVELPISTLVGEDIDAIARYAVEQQLFITLETEGYNPSRLREAILLAEQLGARTIRTFAGVLVWEEIIVLWQDANNHSFKRITMATGNDTNSTTGMH